MATLKGSQAFHFSDMVRDTIQCHGMGFALDYYCVKHGLSVREFCIFAGAELLECFA